jgi:hypothetical protein
MGGGLMQLVAYGAQDIYLTGNPQITFFKVVYRRHTNFSMETIEQTLNGATSGNAGGNVTCTISRNGDLVYRSYVEVDASAADTSDLFSGSDYIAECELEIGGQRVDRHYAEWNQVWEELSTPESKAIGLKAMKRDIGTRTTGVINTMIPLNFWFCRNPGLALPLIALQYHEVKLKIKWGDRVAGSPTVWCDYIYLDTDERRRFAQVSHEYLIEQLQREEKTLSSVSGQSHKLNFNHPVKELIWSYGSGLNLDNVKLVLNGHDRFAQQPDEYFSLKQPLDYHTAVPRQNLPTAAQLMADSVSFSDDRLIGTALLSGDAGAGVVSKATGALTGQLTAPSTGTFTFGQTDTNAYSFGAASRLTGTNGAFAGATPETVAFIFRASEATPVFISGRTYRITVSGSLSVAGTATSKSVIARVTSVQLGTNGVTDAGTITDASQIVYFSKFLTQSADATVAADGTMSFLTVEELVAETVQTTEARTSKMTRKIGVYSFGLKPEEHQPSGTCNFSRIDNAQLNVDPREEALGGDSALTIYAVNYNVLRIMSGMGGLAYSN